MTTLLLVTGLSSGKVLAKDDATSDHYKVSFTLAKGNNYQALGVITGSISKGLVSGDSQVTIGGKEFKNIKLGPFAAAQNSSNQAFSVTIFVTNENIAYAAVQATDCGDFEVYSKPIDSGLTGSITSTSGCTVGITLAPFN